LLNPALWERLSSNSDVRLDIKMIGMTSRVPAPSPRSVSHAGGETIEVHSGWISFLAVGEQTAGAYALIETANHPSAGVPLHVHEREDETWFVLEGEYTFEVGGQTIQAHAGDYVFGPRNVPHSYANRTGALSRALIMVTPAGFGGFWRESSRLGADAAAHEPLWRKYGVRFASKTEK
jgi:quercetin dioxygenase-like cupin family protein